MKFREIKCFPHCVYRVDVAWTSLERHIHQDEEEMGLDLNPDFQRAHVWNEYQQSLYCEYILRGGVSGKELYFNGEWFGSRNDGPYVIVDGKQRLQAVRKFMSGKIKVFGHRFNEFKDKPNMLDARFSWNIAALDSKKDILKWYLNFNSGGSVHTEKELQKVRCMLGEINE